MEGRTNSLIPCLNSLPGCLRWIINQTLESGKAKMFVGCLLQNAQSLGLLQEEWLPSPTRTKALLSPSAHCCALTRPCTSSTFMCWSIYIYWNSAVACALRVRKGNIGRVLWNGVKIFLRFVLCGLLMSFLVKGTIIIVLSAVNEPKLFSRVMLTC